MHKATLTASALASLFEDGYLGIEGEGFDLKLRLGKFTADDVEELESVRSALAGILDELADEDEDDEDLDDDEDFDDDEFEDEDEDEDDD